MEIILMKINARKTLEVVRVVVWTYGIEWNKGGCLEGSDY